MPQELHLLEFIRILKKENLLINPKIVPTGQIALQKIRPFVNANIPTITNVNIATINEKTLNISILIL
jgi:hypothetical protein